MRSPSSGRRPPSLRARLLLAAFALLVCLGATELLLHAMPRLLPAWFRERFPPHGIEFFHPGLLDRTPLDTVPLPYGAEPYDGPPPHDLVDRVVAPASAAASDRAATPRLVLPVDADGLPNAARPERADLVLVGDSFLVYAAQVEPPGLVARLATELGVTTYNLGVSGIGPDQQRGLLSSVGLEKRPRLVLWFFFGGNDVQDSQVVASRRARGMRTWGNVLADRRVPRWRVPALLRELFVAAPRPPGPEAPLPGLPAAADATRTTWFLPEYTWVLAARPEQLAADPGWAGALAALRSAHAASVATGARFVLVFVPSKEQVHLPHVRTDDATLLRYAGLPGEAAAFAAAAMANRGVVERELAAACAAAGIPFWSAAPALDALARDGDSGYYATDTHWNTRGQAAVAQALVAWLREQRVLAR